MIKKFLILGSLCLLLLNCAGNPEFLKEIDRAVHRDEFETGIAAIKKGQAGRKSLYPENNAISMRLDLGLLEHYAGKYSDSSGNLQEAERLIEEAFTKSVSAGVASYIINDNTKAYPGEDYEDIYLNVFNALNYYNRGNLEGAMVEVRKITMSSGKLDMLSRKYENARSTAADWVASQFKIIGHSASPVFPQSKAVNFSDSALARYLSALFYQGKGQLDDARIEFERLHAAFASNKNIYKNPVPSSVNAARNVPSGKARLNIISFTGLSPIKKEAIFPYLFPFFQTPFLKTPVFKLPVLEKRPSAINRIEIIVDEKETFHLELLEDMGAVTEETFNARFSSLFLKTYIRTLLKYAAADVAAIKASEKGASSMALTYIRIARTLIDVSEKADVRMSRYLPEKAYIGGVNLEPGAYTVTVNYYSGGKIIATDVRREIIVKTGTLNLLESISLQ